jgi:signal transduction histidine kinase
LTLSLSFFANKSLAQKNNDSVAINGARAAFKIAGQKPDSALAIAEKCLRQFQSSGDKKLAAFAYKARGWAWMHKGSFDKSIPDLTRSAQLFHELNDQNDETKVYINLALNYSNDSQFSNSTRYLFIADSLARKANDVILIAEAKRQMGILYREQGQYRKAVEYFKESVKADRTLRDTLKFLGAAESLAITYLYMTKPDSSLELLRECVPMVNALKGAAYERSMLNERLGDTWFKLANYNKALGSYSEAYKIFSASDSKSDMAYEALNVGKTLIKIKKYAEAESYLTRSYRINDSLKMINYIPDVAAQMANLYKAEGNWRRAYYWLEKQGTLQDSLHLASQNEKTAQLQAKYEAVKKEKEIALLKKDRELSRITVQRQVAVKQGVITSAILLLLIGVLVVNRYRVAQRTKRTLELEKVRNNIARDLHDDMGSALSSINIISKMALGHANEEQKINKDLQKIHENSGLILENMSDIVWAINPANDTLEKIIFKMREFAAEIFDPLNIGFTFEEKGSLYDLKLGLEVRKDIYLIFKEAVNNAAKYSNCTKVNIAISGDNPGIEMHIEDNGVGFERAKIIEGNGLKNMAGRAAKIDADLSIDSSPGNGTTITLKYIT